MHDFRVTCYGDDEANRAVIASPRIPKNAIHIQYSMDDRAEQSFPFESRTGLPLAQSQEDGLIDPLVGAENEWLTNQG